MKKIWNKIPACVWLSIWKEMKQKFFERCTNSMLRIKTTIYFCCIFGVGRNITGGWITTYWFCRFFLMLEGRSYTFAFWMYMIQHHLSVRCQYKCSFTVQGKVVLTFILKWTQHLRWRHISFYLAGVAAITNRTVQIVQLVLFCQG